MSAGGARRPVVVSGVAIAAIVAALAAATAAFAAPAVPAGRAVLVARPDVALPAVRACRARLPEGTAGWAQVAGYCPALKAQLERSAWAGWLPRSWSSGDSELSAGGLAELEQLIARESRRRPLRPAPDAQQIAAAAAALRPGLERQDGLWARIRAWIRSWFDATRRSDESRAGWLARLLQDATPSSLWRSVAYLLFAAIVLLAAWIVVKELRAAGYLRSRAHRAGIAASTGAAPARRAVVPLAELPLLEQPAEMLRRLLDALRRRGLLAASEHLTVRELLARTTLPPGVASSNVANLALLTEAVRFAPRVPAADVIQRVVAAGGELLRELESTPPAASSR